MPFPAKAYFPLLEVQAEWGARTSDIIYCVLDGLLEVCLLTFNTRVEVGTAAAHSEISVSGPQPLFGGDLWPVFRTGTGSIRQFRPPENLDFVRLPEGDKALIATLEDLFVTREERARFEKAHGLSTPGNSTPTPRDPPIFFEHANNFAEVSFRDLRFHFGPLQAEAVRLLYEANQTANPWRTSKQLLAGSKAALPRIVDVFKTQRHWRDLIQSDGMGRYRLNLPLNWEANRQRRFRRFESLVRGRTA